MQTPFSDLGAVVLAAGKGTRMHSQHPKVLKTLLGEPMLHYVLQALAPLVPSPESGPIPVWSVIGFGMERVRRAFNRGETQFIEQSEQLGTGHALAAAWRELSRKSFKRLLVVNGDTPLIESAVLGDFVAAAIEQNAAVAFMTITPPDPGAFGRVVRNNGEVRAIIEAKEYAEAEYGPSSGEINAGIYCLDTAILDELLPLLNNKNKSGEYYITDLVGLAVARNLTVLGFEAGSNMNLLGINSPAELIAAEEILRKRIVRDWLEKGVLIHAPDAARIGPAVILEPGAELTGPVELYGTSRIASGAVVDSHCRLQDTEVEADTAIRSFSHLEGASIGENCVVGPFARLRPGARLEAGAHAGSFVEIKKSRLGQNAKANHLTYLGDADIGANVNIGAGVITCNYDGVNKHPTTIGKNAFIGSNCSLVAPVTIGDNALVGAGSVITHTVGADELALGRARQTVMPLPERHRRKKK